MSPCLACGACCTLHVTFPASQLRPRGVVPPGVTEPIARDHVRMIGTRPDAGSRCAQLAGEVGVGVSCRMYEHRPEPCRRFAYAWERGEPSPDCDAARARVGLPPLERPG